ncbi:MAG: NFACT RNA binding domain-containing protein [Planctomycetota bacterium]|nr:NFACT RNA binding domain-containing protein [Planctomycetota bacterium]
MSTATPNPNSGLSAAELQAVIRALEPRILGATVLDVAPLRDGDDLLVVLKPRNAGDGAPHKEFLFIALGNRRAHVTLTARRFPRDQQRTGPQTDALRTQLVDRQLMAIEVAEGERRCTFVFGESSPLHLHVELFSARGLWALSAADHGLLELSRLVQTAVRTLRPGDQYAPPPAAPARNRKPTDTTPQAPRFAEPLLESIDSHFGQLDQTTDDERRRSVWSRAANRALQRQQHKRQGMETQLEAAARAPELRTEADLMLAYAHTVERGATSMQVPDPAGADDLLTLDLDPARPVHIQAQARYERARRLTDGQAVTQQRLADCQRDEAELQTVVDRLAEDRDLDATEQDQIGQLLHRHGTLPRPPQPKSKKAPQRKPDRRLLGLNLRQFSSAEGYQILVGRSNAQNDKLSMRIAKGNDLWLHVGGGRAGSHVVVRLPKAKTASLETMLDAATLAVHFSKARGETSIDVIYTLAKHVRKPKGLPPGAVVPSMTKTLTVRLDEDRLRRLLASAPDPD